MADGGPRLAWLDAIARDKPLSLHGVGLSLAADEAPDESHLAALKRLVDRYEPMLVSEHLAWSMRREVYSPDLLPFPRTRAALDRISDNIDRTQAALGRTILIENPSMYLPIVGHDFSEAEFLTVLTRRTGCGLLVDINNAYVSGCNLDYPPDRYLEALPAEAVGEIHLAGHAADGDLLIDTHGAPVSEAVWSLYTRFIERIGPRPTLIERDDAIPAFEGLLAERDRAHVLISRASAHA